ncbi:MAG: EAL domain-containing protein [Lachnospiraceae bacterium]|nr:EAL domain-containing protein [Lachnospiraceae bacterium]
MGQKMSEQEIIAGFEASLEKGEFFVVYQPKVNHSSERLVGAEALIRWEHSEFGMQRPDDFIPVLEKNGLVVRADLFVLEKVCSFLKKCVEINIQTVPVSVNLSPYDIEEESYPDSVDELRKKYDIPVSYIRFEIPEEAVVGRIKQVSTVVSKLHDLGYEVELDNFGSSYSPLNIFRELDVDILKLNMGFLGEKIGGRGGVILRALIQMARWLNIPVIAEGVENREQADFMRSIGCNLIQGYLYSEPLSERDYLELLSKLAYETIAPVIKLSSSINPERFWDPESLDTLIFNCFVGAAAVFSYEDGRVEVLRANPGYVKEIGLTSDGMGDLRLDPWRGLDKTNREIYESTIRQAIVSEEEERCETWRVQSNADYGMERKYISSRIRLIGQSGNQYLFYATVENITARKNDSIELKESEQRYYYANEMANIYSWVYDVATKEMHPCSRCVRDMGLPPLVKNYPEPVIEAEIFPADYADMYRDWHRQIAEGVESLEAVIPLTAGRVPFHVRYTTIFDGEGKPIKAYGSATLVVDGESVLGPDRQD